MMLIWEIFFSWLILLNIYIPIRDTARIKFIEKEKRMAFHELGSKPHALKIRDNVIFILVLCNFQRSVFYLNKSFFMRQRRYLEFKWIVYETRVTIENAFIVLRTLLCIIQYCLGVEEINVIHNGILIFNSTFFL